jgi:hypothetical protein
MNKLYLIFIIPIFLNASLTRSTNFVYDTKNGKIWQDAQENITLRLSHEDAIKYCEDLQIAGKSNWHLASKDEYNLIIDKNRKDEHKINKAFHYSMPVDYWTSDTTWRNFGRYAYYVFFKSGAIYYDNKTYKKFVRCVK